MINRSLFDLPEPKADSVDTDELGMEVIGVSRSYRPSRCLSAVRSETSPLENRVFKTQNDFIKQISSMGASSQGLEHLIHLSMQAEFPLALVNQSFGAATCRTCYQRSPLKRYHQLCKCKGTAKYICSSCYHMERNRFKGCTRCGEPYEGAEKEDVNTRPFTEVVLPKDRNIDIERNYKPFRWGLPRSVLPCQAEQVNHTGY